MDDAVSGWRGQRVMVAGGCRFLGTAVVELLLSHGAEVIGLVGDRAAASAFARYRLAGRVHIIHGRTDDLFRIHSALAVHEVQAVFHFPSAESTSTDRGMITVLEAVRKYDPRVPVVVSRSALAASLITSPVPLGIARFGELFGPDPAARGTVAATIADLLANQLTLLSERGTPDYVHVADAARACLSLAEAVAKRPVPHVHEALFRTGWELAERELSSAIREVLAGRHPFVPFLHPAANPLEWSPRLNFSDALADTVAWYRETSRPCVRPERTRAAA
jgi:nucleoside-diphosphate-sugar epimerase